jgi:hypothetical protein
LIHLLILKLRIYDNTQDIRYTHHGASSSAPSPNLLEQLRKAIVRVYYHRPSISTATVVFEAFSQDRSRWDPSYLDAKEGSKVEVWEKATG